MSPSSMLKFNVEELYMTEENMKYLGLAMVILFAIYIFNKSQRLNDMILEGFSHPDHGKDPTDYKASLESLNKTIKKALKELDVTNNRSDIEDVLTDLSQVVKLGRLHALLQYSQGKLDAVSTNKFAQTLKSLRDMEKAVNSSMEYLDSMQN